MPSYGWAPLPISNSGMTSLLSAWNVFPDFFYLLRTFGSKSFARDEGHCELHMSYVKNDDDELKSIGWSSFMPLVLFKSDKSPCSEICYVLKYADQHDDTKEDVNPWSIRQAMIYQQYDLTTLQSSHIMIRISNCMELQLRTILESDEKIKSAFNRSWTNVHLLCFGSLLGNWHKYVNYLDMKITGLASIPRELSVRFYWLLKFNIVILSPLKREEFREITTNRDLQSAMKRLQYHVDQIARVKNMLDLNMELLHSMRRKVKVFSATLRHRHSSAVFLEGLGTSLQGHVFLKKEVRCLAERATSLSNHVSSPASFRKGRTLIHCSSTHSFGTRSIFGIAKPWWLPQNQLIVAIMPSWTCPIDQLKKPAQSRC